jgi:AmiR/NasT family two-component response regulator
MADTLGVVAAVAQFLDIAVRLFSEINKLYHDLRNVPDQLQLLKSNLD